MTHKKGLRCRAKRQLRTHAGVIDASSQGTIVAEIDSFGRHLIEVEWDNSIRVYVYPQEIENLTKSIQPIE
ncbi:MAG TPA: hypothetical protein VE131_03030 [Terriglobales bacterium]|nr:hypothetical protein [Terriglobales bacterium]